ncbi:hypothetical protein ACCS93_29980 [Rhizobium ruizarguesonis]
MFVDFRWADNGGKPCYPRCGCLEPYSVRRRRFRCSQPECRAEFSVTSGTVFANRMLSFKKTIMAVRVVIEAARRRSSSGNPTSLGGRDLLPDRMPRSRLRCQRQ